jgi:N utilization substance protein B
MTRRTRGREIALQVLYQIEQNPGQGAGEVDRFIARRLREPKLCDFAHGLVNGVLEHQPRIDALISEVAENWRLDRMAAIDRNILRLGAYELLYCDDVPAKVAINEALELAKRYSTAQSSRFVNGILDRLQAAGAAQAAKTPAVEEAPAVEVEQAIEATTTVETEGLGGLAVVEETPESSAPVEETPPVPPPTDEP